MRPPRSWFPWPAASLRAYFIVITVLATVPMTILMAALITEEVQASRVRLEANLARTAASLARTVEREIASSMDALYILSYSDALQRGDVPGMFSAMSALPKPRNSWSSSFLVDLDGDVLFNTRQPAGRPLGKVTDMAALDRLKRTGQAVTTDLIPAPDGQYSTAILVPVVIEGRISYALGAWIPPSSWGRLIGTATLSPHGFTSIFDSHMRLLASQGRGGQVDQPLPVLTQARIHGAATGNARIEVPGAAQAYGSWRTLSGSGWGVMIGEAAEPIDRLHWMSISATLGIGFLSLTAGLLLAMRVARRVTDPLRSLATQGPSEPGLRSGIRELDLLEHALREAEAQREAARERLQAQADEFETLFQSSPIGLAITQTPSCEKVLRNPALARMLNEPDNDPAPHAMPRTGWPSHQMRRNGKVLPTHEQPLQRASRTGERQSNIELEVVHADGRTLKLIAHAVPLFDMHGQPRGAIATFTDITARKEAEESLVMAERRLRESQHLIELAQAAGHVGFFKLDFARATMAWTTGVAWLFGLTTSESQSPWRAWLHRIHPADRLAVWRLIRGTIADRGDHARFEFRTRRPDGIERWLSCKLMVVYDGDDAPMQMNGVVVDITQQKFIDEERAALVDRETHARLEAESANRAKDEFLAMLGHELRNPLGAISAGTEVLNRAQAQPDLAARARQIITRQTRHLGRLMDDLLDVARVITGKILLVPEPLRLDQLAQRVVHTFEMAGQWQSHTLEIHLEAVWVNADTTRMEQVITNLLGNALKYTPPQGLIALTVRQEHGEAVLQVRDDGIGMSPDLMARAFDLFAQGERSLDRRQGGLGIGLTLVKRLAELHGGRVFVHSAGVQQGTTFTLRMPAIEEMPPEHRMAATGTTPSAKAEEASVATASRPGGCRIVVVEDNDDAREALLAMLSLNGHWSQAAQDGEAGVALILEHHPDLALVDIGLPQLNGYQVAQRLREHGYAGWLVALSGYGQSEDIARSRAAGFDEHLVKPVNADKLDEVLARACAPRPSAPWSDHIDTLE